MKEIRSKKSRTALYVVTFFVLISTAAAGIIYWKLRPPAKHPTHPQVSLPHTPPQNPEPVVVKLGSSHIVAINEDYTHDDSLWRLVNKANPLTNPNYEPAKLTKAPVAVRPNLREDEQSLHTVLVPDLQAMVKQAAADGVTLTLGSGYRSPELQRFFFDNYAARDGVEAANKYSALPGQSEHQTGLSLDFAAGDMRCYLEQCFAETSAGMWLAEHAHKYGFILRYTKDGETTTGYQFEPWHYRYVGKELATALHDNNILLEDAWPKLLEARKELIVRGEIK